MKGSGNNFRTHCTYYISIILNLLTNSKMANQELTWFQGALLCFLLAPQSKKGMSIMLVENNCHLGIRTYMYVW